MSRDASPRYAEHIGVVEAEPRHNPHALLGKQRLEARIVGRRALAQDLEEDRSGVFDIGVDVAGLQAVPEHARAAELAPVRRGYPFAFEEPGHHLAEDHGFGEGFRADHHAGRAAFIGLPGG